ncbi:allantoate permease [Colletotrichum costaricense]|uniref:Allantoate permease n=1 Tax=Colletotrichum costaricense TaxID=1209916 RepID=A0AAI9YMW6_9PEZI|nr:allantoate permease [Colletotrichum costaricense]KAK1516880.1 allantoate permease [Colletotrichum costaricense]
MTNDTTRDSRHTALDDGSFTVSGAYDKYAPSQAVKLETIGEEALAIDLVIEKRVLQKIDLFLMPAMVIGYGLVYYDKAILGSAALFGMTDDLHLSVVDTSFSPPKTDTTRLSWATSIFYFGQLIGFTESVIPTAFMTTVSGYYTQREQALRQSWWFSGTGWFTIIGSALNYGFAQIQGGALTPWQYIYVLAGGLTFLFGIWCFFLPNSPLTAWFLTPEERAVAIERLRQGQTGVKNQTIKTAQIKEALLDVKVWLVALTMASGYTVNGAVSGFGPLIVSTFGYSALDSILFQFPLGAICAIGIPVAGWLCSKYRNIRILVLIGCTLPVIAGFVIIWKSDWGHRPIAPVVGYSLIGFFGPVVSLTVTLGASNVAGETKKSFMASAVFVAYCVGNIVGPQLVKSETKPQHYPQLWTGLIICYCITILSSLGLYVILYRENRRRDALGLDESERDRLAFKDLTDKENEHFRYVL